MIDQVLTSEEVKDAVLGVAAHVRDKSKHRIALVGVMDGAFQFLTDLTRTLGGLGVEVFRVSTIRTRSYKGKENHGPVLVTADWEGLRETFRTPDLSIWFVEDILDTGKTIHEILRVCLCHGILSFGEDSTEVGLAALLHKGKVDITDHTTLHGFGNFRLYLPTVVGRKVGGFVVGYGLDHDGRFRDRQDIGVMDEEE